jgi:hypothetical protein
MCTLRILSERKAAAEAADDLHHPGLTTLIMIRLAQFAEDRQITCFFAEVPPENGDMLAVLRDGFAAVTITGRDDVEIEFPTASWRATHAPFKR